MSETRNFKEKDRVYYSEKPGEVFVIKVAYYSVPIHHSEPSKPRVVAEAVIDGKTFEVDAPEYYFIYAEE